MPAAQERDDGRQVVDQVHRRGDNSRSGRVGGIHTSRNARLQLLNVAVDLIADAGQRRLDQVAQTAVPRPRQPCRKRGSHRIDRQKNSRQALSRELRQSKRERAERSDPVRDGLESHDQTGREGASQACHEETGCAAGSEAKVTNRARG